MSIPRSSGWWWARLLCPVRAARSAWRRSARPVRSPARRWARSARRAMVAMRQRGGEPALLVERDDGAVAEGLDLLGPAEPHDLFGLGRAGRAAGRG
jgi:hypothetical protein